MRRLWNYFEVVFLGYFCLVSLASLETPDGLELQLHDYFLFVGGFVSATDRPTVHTR